jgi:hypothetical protein
VNDTVEHSDTLFLKLAPGGGTAIRFIPIEEKKAPKKSE